MQARRVDLEPRLGGDRRLARLRQGLAGGADRRGSAGGRSGRRAGGGGSRLRRGGLGRQVAAGAAGYFSNRYWKPMRITTEATIAMRRFFWSIRSNAGRDRGRDRSRCRPMDGSGTAGAPPGDVAAQRPVRSDRLGGVMRTARQISAGRRQHRSQQQLIGADRRAQHQPDHHPGMAEDCHLILLRRAHLLEQAGAKAAAAPLRDRRAARA